MSEKGRLGSYSLTRKSAVIVSNKESECLQNYYSLCMEYSIQKENEDESSKRQRETKKLYESNFRLLLPVLPHPLRRYFSGKCLYYYT